MPLGYSKATQAIHNSPVTISSARRSGRSHANPPVISDARQIHYVRPVTEAIAG